MPDAHSSAGRSLWACGEPRPRPRLVVASCRRGDEVFQADRTAIAIAQALNEIDPWLAAAAVAYKKDESWQRHGFARLEDHCREVFGCSGRWLRDMAAMGEAIAQEPDLERALTGGDGGTSLGRCRATLIARVATRATLKEWIALARACSVVELKRRILQAREAGSGSPLDADDPRIVPEGEPDTEERCRVKLPVPFPVAVAFDEGLELFRAVEGTDASVTSFVEALSAEQVASGRAQTDSVDRSSMQSGEGRALIEQRLASRTHLWSALPRAGSALVRIEELRPATTEGTSEPVRRIEDLVEIEDRLERHLGELLLSMSEAQAWSRLGFAGAGHYAEQRLGVSRSWAEDRLRGARALRRYPRLRDAYEARSIGLEALLKVARLLDRSEDPDAIIEAWVRQASECTVKRLRDEARELTRRRAGADAEWEAPARDAPLSDRAWFRSLRRKAGTARERIEKLANLALVRAVADTTLMLCLPDDVADMFLQSLAAASCRTFSTAGGVTPAWAGLLVMLEDFARTWDHDENDPRRRVCVNEAFIAFGWRCAAPGCTSRCRLQVHHVVYRSRGGSDEADNLLVLCLFHHLRGEHGDWAACRGRSPLGIVWRLGSKDAAACYRNERLFSRATHLSSCTMAGDQVSNL
ncbi:MAG: hypothetical protein ACREAA_00580 [Candidatus Polarisedimenticolia bacterium]